jgi:L-ascorbate metabolism protein UlaG (beta-lactamase superfamily)
MSRLTISLFALVFLAKDFVAPDQISYDEVPGFRAIAGSEILEWDQISAASSTEPKVLASLDAPKGLRLRWLGAAGFEISDDQTAILIDPFVSRPDFLQALVPLIKLKIDTEAVDRYVLDPMKASGIFHNLRAILVSHPHHDHAEDVPYILSRFPRVSFALRDVRPLVVGDRNLAALLKAYDGRQEQIPWLQGVERLSSGRRQIIDFDKKLMKQLKDGKPPDGKPLGRRIAGDFGNFRITAFIGEHGLYDDTTFTLQGTIWGKAPFAGDQYRAYLNSSLTYLIEYVVGGKTKLRIFAADGARSLDQKDVSREVAADGPVDILLQGIAARKKENAIPDRIEGFQPKYFIPTHYDNFFVPFTEFRNFDFTIQMQTDNSALVDFLRTFSKTAEKSPGTRLRMMKMFYYYSLENLLEANR